MGWEPKQACKRPGCPELVASGYCPTHTFKKKDARVNRPSSSRRGYGAKWQAARHQYLKRNPYCVDPFQIHRGEFAKANEVDHIIPHQGNQQLFWNRGNWQPLCKTCHSKKTSIDQKHQLEDLWKEESPA